MNDEPSRPTLAVVADAASVSVSTASKVLNGKSDVSDATRQRVERALESLGYSRRGDPRPHGELIEVVFERLGPWAVELLKGVEAVARQQGISTVVTIGGTFDAQPESWIDAVMRRQPLGVILVFSTLSDREKRQLRTRNIPFVVVDPAGDPDPDLPTIGSANWDGGLMATRHLIELGHTRIGTICGPPSLRNARARLAGYRSAHESAAIDIDPSLIVPGDFSVEAGRRGVDQLLALDVAPTAIFAQSDLEALGAYRALQSRGVRIPHDISVIGYDDLPMAELASPALTTIRQPLEEIASAATRLILRLRAAGPVRNIRTELATTLVVRESTAVARPVR
ncbi:LacI family DNA-binding transcriptional regulator [Microbacterium marmarense]|uniref:LacI family DNA-binding transcriptional regulator n=1 Tax=Microbacterium marmarense TaxID=3122051 RepID=A0ABU8LR66_9MICO